VSFTRASAITASLVLKFRNPPLVKRFTVTSTARRSSRRASAADLFKVKEATNKPTPPLLLLGPEEEEEEAELRSPLLLPPPPLWVRLLVDGSKTKGPQRPP
jgi:hypothetical protein